MTNAIGQPGGAHKPGAFPGDIVSGEELWKRLGYRTAAAFRQAAYRNTVPIHVFDLPNRRGKHAFRTELDAWVSQLVSREAGGAGCSVDAEGST